MSKNTISLTDENHEALKKAADQQGKPMSVILNNILSNAGLGNKTVESVVLHVPIELTKENKYNSLRIWLLARIDQIVKHFYLDGRLKK